MRRTSTRAVAHVAEAAEALLLEHLQQLRLDREVHVADLVEEHRAAVRDLEQPGFAVVAPVKAPFSWPNSSVSSSSRDRPAQFRSTNGSRARGPLLVQPARQHALAGAGLAVDQHRRWLLDDAAAPAPRERGSRASRPRNGAIDWPRLADLAPATLAAVAAGGRGPAIEHQQRGELDRLGEELLGALLDRVHREVDRAVGGQDDDGHVPVEALKAVSSSSALPSGSE